MSMYSYPQQEEGLTLPVTPEILKSNEGNFIETSIKHIGTVSGRLIEYHDETGMADIEIFGPYDEFTSVHYTDLDGISPLIPEYSSGKRQRPRPRPRPRPFLRPLFSRPYLRPSYLRPYLRPSFPRPYPSLLPAFAPYPGPYLRPYLWSFPGLYPRP